jgi:hypothetical protein
VTARKRAPDPDELVVEKVGLGYVGTLVSQGVTIALDRIYESRGEVVGELTVERAPEGHLLRAKFSASSRADRSQTASDLGARSNNIVWREVLEQFCLKVLDQERHGEDFVMLGTSEEPAKPVRFMLRPVLVQRRPIIIFGEGGVGKSTLAAAITVSVASGISAVEGWSVDVSGPVLILDWEADAEEWSALVAAVSRGIGTEVPKNIHYRTGTGPLTDHLDEIAQHVAQPGIVLLIIDSVGLAMPSRADGADANEGALKLFAALRHLGLTTLLIDHVAGTDMGSDRPVAKPYGSVYKYNLGRNVFELRNSPNPSADGVMHLELHNRKANRTAKLSVTGLAVHHGEDELLITREEVEHAELNAAVPLHARIHTLLLAGGRTPSAIAKAVNSTEGTVRETLRRMATMGIVTRLKAKQGREFVWAAAVPAGVHAPGETQHVTQQTWQPVNNESEDLFS